MAPTPVKEAAAAAVSVSVVPSFVGPIAPPTSLDINGLHGNGTAASMIDTLANTMDANATSQRVLANH